LHPFTQTIAQFKQGEVVNVLSDSDYLGLVEGDRWLGFVGCEGFTQVQ
jgi:hypothetical protein